MPHSCGTRNGLQVFEKEDGTVDGYCFSCNSYVADPLGKGKTVADIPPAKRLGKTKEEIAEEMEFISTLKAHNLNDRRISAKCLEYYGIKVGFSEQDGKTVAFHYYPYSLDGELKAYKARLVAKKRMWSIGDQKEVDLFGWEQAVKSGARRLIIVEGELDAASAYGIIEKHTMDKYEGLKPAVVSLPHGAASAKRDIARLLTKIRRQFKEVLLCFDNDKAGKDAMHEVCTIMPEAQTIELPEKDANECILQGVTKAAFNAMTFKAEKPKTSKLVWGADVHEAAKKQAEWGLSWPWEKMTQYTRGIRFGETIYIAAGEKMGLQ